MPQRWSSSRRVRARSLKLNGCGMVHGFSFTFGRLDLLSIHKRELVAHEQHLGQLLPPRERDGQRAVETGGGFPHLPGVFVVRLQPHGDGPDERIVVDVRAAIGHEIDRIALLDGERCRSS